MPNHQRQYPIFSACGLNCGLCPRYHTDGTSRCPGCAGEGFGTVHPSCGVLSCSQQKGVEVCCLCDEYPCKRYDGVDVSDSFLTHRNQLRDLEKAKEIGLDAYITEQNEKVELLWDLLDNYNDGRQKNFFCIAVNLLELQDIKDIIAQIHNETKPDDSGKEKSKIAVRLFRAIADEKNIMLKLRKKR